jgi:hypothetical protein
MAEKQLKLQYIRITMNESWQANPGQYKGELKYNGQHGAVEVQLDEELSAEVLKLVGESLTRATKELVTGLSAAVFEGASTNLLESIE